MEGILNEMLLCEIAFVNLGGREERGLPCASQGRSPASKIQRHRPQQLLWSLRKPLCPDSSRRAQIIVCDIKP